MYIGAKADAWGKRNVILVGALIAVAFFALLPFATEPWMVLALQLPNAAWVAIILSIPVTYLQDALPGKVGLASALYSAAFKIGAFLGGCVAGVVADLFGFTRGFWACAALAAVSAAVLVRERWRSCVRV
jgi:SET family sugar efflux transporter-like MFS transporter